MRFVEVKDKNITKKWGKNQALILQFLESGLDIAEVLDWDVATADICAGGLQATAKKHNLGIKAFSVNGRVFLERIA